jgi:hypothetical protein
MANAIIFDDDDTEKEWCNSPCDALLIKRRDGSRICSYCGREYLPNSVSKHKSTLGPNKTPQESESDGPLVVPLSGYGQYTPKKRNTNPTADKEDRLWLSQGSGRSIVSSEDYWPED